MEFDFAEHLRQLQTQQQQPEFAGPIPDFAELMSRQRSASELFGAPQQSQHYASPFEFQSRTSQLSLNDSVKLARTRTVDSDWLQTPLSYLLSDEDFVFSRGAAARNELDKDDLPNEFNQVWQPPSDVNLPDLLFEGADLTIGLAEALVRQLSSVCCVRTIFSTLTNHRSLLMRRVLLALRREALRRAKVDIVMH